ncbi:hypothetical protein [Sulfurospirillum arcachonense]|uniref:hypothetical protein n=1 Tax=Sulfurospirillum arcachonense TaxID=57666 RepID=UPI00046B0A8E|nr:hypothetical protein [Sulfurospirillum arcachonense]
MMNRLLNSLFMGFIFISILDFLYFIGLKLNYFDLYKIDEYFNVIFFDNQNFYILVPVSLVVGYLLMYSKFSKLFMKVYVVVILLFASTLYEPIGKSFGQSIFMQENQRLKLGSTTFSGDTLYIGRKNIYIYRKELAKTVKLKKDEVKNLTIF